MFNDRSEFLSQILVTVRLNAYLVIPTSSFKISLLVMKTKISSSESLEVQKNLYIEKSGKTLITRLTL